MRRPWCRVIEVEKQILEEISNIGSGRDLIRTRGFMETTKSEHR